MDFYSNVTSSVSILHQLGLTDCGLMAAMDNEILFLGDLVMIKNI